MTDTQPSPQLPPGSDQNRAPAYQAFLIFLTILVTVVIILRFYSRALGPRHTSGQSVHRFWWDDWVALLSVVRLDVSLHQRPSLESYFVPDSS